VQTPAPILTSMMFKLLQQCHQCPAARSRLDPLICLGPFTREQSPSKAWPLFPTSLHCPSTDSSGGALPQPSERAEVIVRLCSEFELHQEQCTERTMVRCDVCLETNCSPNKRGPLLHVSLSSSKPEDLVALSLIKSSRRRTSWFE